MVNLITDVGNRINVQVSADTSVLASRAALQAGDAVTCRATLIAPAAFNCSMSPVLTGYSQGMVVHWIPSVSPAADGPTLNIDLLGPVPVRRPDGFTSVSVGEITGGQMYPVWYDGQVFRMMSGSGGGTSGSSTPTSLTSTTAGGPTTIITSAEWHAPLAGCIPSTGPVLLWDAPPAGSTPAAPGGCAATDVSDAFASFAATGTPSLQTSLILPATLTGTADVRLYYSSPVSNGTFSLALDVLCVATDGSSVNDGVFPSGNFFAPGSATAPLLASALGSLSAVDLNWPASCVAGSRAHLRLRRLDTSGTASPVNVSEVVVVLRRRS